MLFELYMTAHSTIKDNVRRLQNMVKYAPTGVRFVKSLKTYFFSRSQAIWMKVVFLTAQLMPSTLTQVPEHVTT